jgi:hypothetical protein
MFSIPRLWTTAFAGWLAVVLVSAGAPLPSAEGRHEVSRPDGSRSGHLPLYVEVEEESEQRGSQVRFEEPQQDHDHFLEVAVVLALRSIRLEQHVSRGAGRTYEQRSDRLAAAGTLLTSAARAPPRA